MESRDEPLKNSQDRKTSGSKHIDNTFILVLDWCNQYGAAITAVATIVLALITYFYLQETRKQRELFYIQLEHTISPDVSIMLLGYRYAKDVASIEVSFQNSGGPTGEFNYGIYLICCNKIQDLMNNIKNTIVLFKPGRIARLSPNLGRRITVEIPNEYKNQFEEASKSQSNQRLITLFITMTYVKPKITTQDRITNVTQSESFGWSPKYKHWNSTSNKGHKIIYLFLKEKDFLKGK